MELLDLLAECDLDAVLPVELRDLLRELRRGERRHEPVAHLDDRHVEPEHAQRSGDLGSNEAAADDEGLACRRHFLLHCHGVGERSERMHRGQVGSGHGKRTRPG